MQPAMDREQERNKDLVQEDDRPLERVEGVAREGGGHGRLVVQRVHAAVERLPAVHPAVRPVEPGVVEEVERRDCQKSVGPSSDPLDLSRIKLGEAWPQGEGLDAGEDEGLDGDRAFRVFCFLKFFCFFFPGWTGKKSIFFFFFEFLFEAFFSFLFSSNPDGFL